MIPSSMCTVAIAIGIVRVGAAAYIDTWAAHATELMPENIDVARAIGGDGNIAVAHTIGGDETAAVSVPCGSVIVK
jgi:hypothetical protein